MFERNVSFCVRKRKKFLQKHELCAKRKFILRREEDFILLIFWIKK